MKFHQTLSEAEYVAASLYFKFVFNEAASSRTAMAGIDHCFVDHDPNNCMAGLC